MKNDGFTAALKFWCIFLLVFFLLRYPPGFSIMLGAIAALAGGYIVTHWTTKDQTPPKVSVQRQEEEGPLGLRDRTQMRKQRPKSKSTPVAVPAFLQRFFVRKPIPSFKSKRQKS